MKKIICLIESLGSGGAERQITGLAILLQEQGYEVEVWYYAPRHFYCDELKRHDVTYRYIGKALNKIKRIGIIRKMLLKTKPDTVIAYLDSPSVIGCISKITGGKFNLIVSERNTTQHLGIMERMKFFLYRFADHIVPNSFSQGEFIKRNYTNLKNKITCITNFVDTDKFKPTLDKEYNTKTRILTVARIMPQKNVIKYIQAIKKVAETGCNFEVCWFGNYISDEYFNKCKQTITELGIENIFKFYPATSNILEEYHKADIFCLPSIYEGFPNVVCEAMCCGLPIVCSNICDNPNIVTHNNGFLFNPENIESMANTIIEAINTTNEQRELISRSCRERSIELFSKHKFVKAYTKLL